MKKVLLYVVLVILSICALILLLLPEATKIVGSRLILLGLHLQALSGKSSSGRCAASEYARALSVSTTSDWTISFSVMESSPLSYVWYLEEKDADLVAYVLLDSTGNASGIVSYNQSVFYITDSTGSIWRIDIHDTTRKEIFSYKKNGLSGSPFALTLWFETGQLFWSDRDAGAVYACDFDGSQFYTVTTGIMNPYDLSMSPQESLLYISDLEANSIFTVDPSRLGTNCNTQRNVSTFLHISSPISIWLDVYSEFLYFVSYYESFVGKIPIGDHQEQVSLVLNSTSFHEMSPVSIALDSANQLLFYATAESLNVHSLSTKEHYVLLYLNGIRFLAIDSHVPSPNPTLAPTTEFTQSTENPTPELGSEIPTAIQHPVVTPTPFPTSYCSFMQKKCDLCSCSSS